MHIFALTLIYQYTSVLSVPLKNGTKRAKLTLLEGRTPGYQFKISNQALLTLCRRQSGPITSPILDMSLQLEIKAPLPREAAVLLSKRDHMGEYAPRLVQYGLPLHPDQPQLI